MGDLNIPTAPPVDGAEPLHSGKVRDLYRIVDGEHAGLLLMVASDRISAYDYVLDSTIPDKGAILTRLSLWWFEQLADLVPNHVISAEDVPPEWVARATRCRRLRILPVECIARGYLAGLGLKEYERDQAISGVQLRPGLVEGSRLPEPVFTPTTKEEPGSGVHDAFITLDDVIAGYGRDLAERL